MPKLLSFSCCSRTTQNLCCRQCLGMFHPNCLEKRQDWSPINGHVIYCSQECFDKYNPKDTEIEKYVNAIERLKEEIDQKDETIGKLKRRSEHFETDVIEAEKNYEDDIKKLTLTLESMHTKISGYEEKMAKLQTENEFLQQSVVNNNAEKNEMTTTQKELVNCIENLRKECIQKDIDLENLKSEITHLKSERLAANSSQTNKKSFHEEMDEQIHEIATIVKTDLQAIFQKKFVQLQQQIKSLENAQKQAAHSTLDNKKSENSSKTRKTLDGKDKRKINSPITERETPINNQWGEMSKTHNKAVNQSHNLRRDNNINSKKKVSNSLVEATENKMAEIINVESETTSSTKLSSPNLKTQVVVQTQGDVLDENDTIDGNEDWKLVSRMKGTKNVNNKRPAPKIGTNSETHTLKAIQPRSLCWIFVSKLDMKTQPEDIIQFLSQQNPGGGYQCIKMKTQKDHIYSSFRIGVPVDEKHRIMDADLWPEGTVINHFLNIQRRQSQLQKTLQEGKKP